MNSQTMEQTVIGKYNTAKVFTNVVEQSAIDQIKLLCDQPFTQGSEIRVMPDVHAGTGCTIGTGSVATFCHSHRPFRQEYTASDAPEAVTPPAI